MIYYNKFNSLIFVSNQKLKAKNTTKNFLRTSNMLRNRFSSYSNSAFSFEKSGQLNLSNISFQTENNKKSNFEVLNNKDFEFNKAKQMFSLFKSQFFITPLVTTQQQNNLNKSAHSALLLKNSKSKLRLNGEFFPAKKAFIHYWIFPFVGFAGYIYLNKYNSTVNSSLVKISNTGLVQNFQSEKKQIDLFVNNVTRAEKIEKNFTVLNVENNLLCNKENALKFTVFQNEKEEAKAAFFITNFLNQIEKNKNLEKQFEVNTAFVVGDSRQQNFNKNLIPQKLLPICQTIKLDDHLAKFVFSQKTMEINYSSNNSRFYQHPSYSYIQATKIIDSLAQEFKQSNLSANQFLSSFGLGTLVQSESNSSEGLLSNKHYLNSHLIKQVNQILNFSLKNYRDFYSTTSKQPLMLKTRVQKFENSKTPSEVSKLFKSKTETLKNQFHSLFLVKYLLHKTQHTHFVNKKLPSFVSLRSIAFGQQKEHNSLFNGQKQKLTQKNLILTNKKNLNLKMQDFLMILNKIQTRQNLEFINTYKNAFPILTTNFNNSKTPFLKDTSLISFELKPYDFFMNFSLCLGRKVTSCQSLRLKHQETPLLSSEVKNSQQISSLNNLKWSLYELATLRFFKKFVDPSLNEVSTTLYNLGRYKKSYIFKDHQSLSSTKLSSILNTVYTQKNFNIIDSKSNELNGNNNKIFRYHNPVPMCFSVSLNAKDCNQSFFGYKNSLLLTRNLQNTMSPYFTKVKAPENSLPISVISTENNFLKTGFNLKNFASTNDFTAKCFIVFQHHNENLFIENKDSFLKNKLLKLNNIKNVDTFTSDLLFIKNTNNLFAKNSNSHDKVLNALHGKDGQKNKLFILKLKHKKNYKIHNTLYLKNLATRRQEKVFRAYLSNQYNEKNIKTQTFFADLYVQKTLKKLKKRFFANNLIEKANFRLVQENNLEKIQSVNKFSNQNENQDCVNSNYPVNQQRYTSNTLLRKLGFLFKYKSEFINKETWDRVEKHRSSQKKRRRKKQKRFYPRPSWLRFLFYGNFLTSRHFSLHKKNYLSKKKMNSVCLVKNTNIIRNKTNIPFYSCSNIGLTNKTRQTKKTVLNVFKSYQYSPMKQFAPKIFRKNLKYQVLQQQQTSFTPMFDKQLSNEKKILHKTSQIFDLSKSNSLTSFTALQSNNNMFHSQEYYQISNEVMSDFQRLCWKSYWLRSSLTPYIRRIQNSMQKIREIETQSGRLNKSLTTPNIKTSFENNLKSFNFNRNADQLNWYLNFKNSLQSNSQMSNFVEFQNLQNRSEYERILYQRISDIIENVKANLDGSGQSRAKSFKVGRTRKDNINLRRPFAMSSNYSGSQRKIYKFSDDSFISRFGLFVNNTLNTPNISAFSLQSIMDQSVKPFGELPTLRSFWALNRTNALSGFAQAKTNTGQPEKPQWKQLTETKSLWSVLKFREQNASNKTKKFFSLVWKKLVLMPFTYQGLNNLEKISLQKVEVANKKLNYLGIYLKSNKSILKYWKNKLPVVKSGTKVFAFKANKGSAVSMYTANETGLTLNSDHKYMFNLKNLEISDKFAREKTDVLVNLNKETMNNLQSQKQAKRSIHFWWSFPEFTKGFHTFSFETSLNFMNGSSFYKPEFLMCQNQTFEFNNALLFLTTLGGCTVLFHLCSLYSFLQSSQIRSLSKFYILVLYKFSNAYLILVYSIFHLMKTYLKQLSFVFSLLTKLKKSHPSNSNFLAVSQTTAINNLLTQNEQRNNVFFDQASFDFFQSKTSSRDNTFTSQVPLHTVKSRKNQIFFYGAYEQNVKGSFTLYKHFYVLTNFKNTMNQSNNKQMELKSNPKNHLILKFLNLQAFNIRFFSEQTKDLTSFFMTTPKLPHFSILEMCFYSPNLKIKRLLLTKDQEKNSLGIRSTEYMKILQQQGNEKLFLANQNFVYSSTKNLKNFIYSTLLNSQKQKYTSRYYLQKDFALTKESLFFAMNKSFQDFYSKLWVGFLLITKSSVSLLYNTISFGSLILFKIIDLLENFIMLIYKFLEKPAEFMIEWIAQLFLVEWSSDITTFVPESFDIYTWRSFNKLSRGSRIFTVFGFLMQRRLWCLFEIYLSLLSKPDVDLLNRQKKGMIFWDVWAEILITAAEKYRINLSSLTTVKEEQEAFLERLLNDPNWLSSWDSSHHLTTSNSNFVQKSTGGKKFAKQTRALAELELLATAGIRPESWLGRQSFFIKEAGLQTTGFEGLVSNFNENFETSRSTYSLNFLNNRFSNHIRKVNNNHSLSSLPSFRFKNESFYFVSDFNFNWKTWQRWSTNQHFTSQGSDTELFIDVHPPKSFAHVSQLKSTQSGISSGIAGLSTLGSLTCMIYSGLFSKQVSKNILIVGSPGNSQTLLIQALAGETELKIIADNAHRYAHIQRGIAVGMKLLRDVFDGLALHTPCLFLMEDIHVIGERRPMLISDNENAKAAESSFASENEEVHEKNMFIYQLNKHAITDYRKPYKGDFSLLIPTNHFCFDLFLGVSPPKIRKNGKTTRSPFSLETKFYETQKDSTSAEQEKKSTNIVLKSLLQKTSEQFFAPPATSPFNILGMKEQRQFKAIQIVKEIPWGGFSNDQMMLLPKSTYSIRVKIALLADLAMNQLSVKLDMITDLLVIMDNVRSNRGFVVFATTHVPFVLDPALRRPGRLDETISLPFAPTLIDRFEILKTSLSNYTTTFDFMSYSFLLQNYNETDLSNFISRTKLLLFNNLTDYSPKSNQNNFSKENQILTRKNKLTQTTISSLNTALSFMTEVEVTDPQKLYQRVQKARQKLHQTNKVNKLSVTNFTGFDKNQKTILELLKLSKIRSTISASPSTVISTTYSQISKFIIGSQLLKDTRVFRNIVPSFEESIEDGEPTIFRNLYSSSIDIQNTLLYLLSAKAGEIFFFNHFKLVQNIHNFSPISLSNFKNQQDTSNSLSTFSLKPSLANPELNTGLWNVSTPLSQTNFTKNQSSTFLNNQVGGRPQVEELWSSATSFVFALVQKRYLYHKTLLMTRLLYFNDIAMLREPPSPPGSSILMPAKRYENLKRTERDFQQKPAYSILEKIMLHQQQRFMKKLYERPVIEVFKSEIVQNRNTSFNSSIKELGYYDSFMRKPSSTHSFYRNRILTRHKFSFINQWWNGQLAEHNLESTFSSDVDWRSMFVESFGDLVIDFPDADQHYNPKSRRWFLQSTYGGYWNSFEKTVSFEVYQHYIIICFTKAINHLHTERELLDSLAYTYLQKGSFKELDLLATLSRFNN